MNRAESERAIAQLETSGARPRAAAVRRLNRYSARREIDALDPGGRGAPLYPSMSYADAVRAYLARVFGVAE